MSVLVRHKLLVGRITGGRKGTVDSRISVMVVTLLMITPPRTIFAEEEGTVAAVCGSFDCVQDLAGGVNVMSRVCKLRAKTRCVGGIQNRQVKTFTGTGVLFDCGNGKKNRILTNAHLLEWEGDAAFCPGGRTKATEVVAEFGYLHSGDPCTPTSPCTGPTRIAKMTCSKLHANCDVAVIGLGEELTAIAEPPLQIAQGDEPTAAEALYIPQHPQGRCQEFALGNIVRYLDPTCGVEYNISTEHGSSGASIIRKSDGKIVGVHGGSQTLACPNLATRLAALQSIVPQLCQKLGQSTESAELSAAAGPDEIQSICLVPAASSWGLLNLGLTIMVAGTLVLRQRRVPHTAPRTQVCA